MAITTTPQFFYIGSVTTTNNKLNFDEGGGELTATITVRSYSISELVEAVASAMTSAGGQTYTVTFDRTTRFVTISAPGNFSLLPVTGSNSPISILPLTGFTTDRAGTNTYLSDTEMGSVYSPLFPLQNFRGFEDNKEKVSPSVNESASGLVVETISFGERQLMSFNIRYVTDRAASVKPSIFGNNPTMVQDTRDFLDFIIEKTRLEFMKDVTDPNTFDVILLNSTSKSKTGTSYELRELYSVGIGYYETGALTFRKIS